jgi:cathepsin B
MIPLAQKHNAKWTPGRNKYFYGQTKEQMAKLMGTKMDMKPMAPMVFPQTSQALPDTFDARTNWNNCPSIAFIRDQASCGSCWAVSSAEAMSDRICIGSNGKTQVYVSDEDLMTCCKNCGEGCDGGYPIQAWKYWQKTGLVTGGPYGSNQGCQPYEIPPCGSDGCGGTDTKTPSCSLTCESSYRTPFMNDKHYGASAYTVGNGVTGMQQELFTNGPVVAAFNVYEDFYSYTSGVYHHIWGSLVGGHAVKVIGWGVEDDTPYWLVANSWNETWGMNGLFKIIRGTNDCDFESSIVAGLAKQ